ncbi:MAG: hypothetical protein SGPRY_009022 [Prymnesium sp.]
MRRCWPWLLLASLWLLLAWNASLRYARVSPRVLRPSAARRRAQPRSAESTHRSFRAFAELRAPSVSGRQPEASSDGDAVLFASQPTGALHLDSEVIAFYYPWYGTPRIDGRWLHWNHQFLPHWERSVTDRFPKGRHEPPDDLGSTYYPQLGPYSSQDPAVIESHMQQLSRAAVGTISVSWYPPHLADNEGIPVDALIPILLSRAHANGLKLCLHIEPYANRTARSVSSDLQYVATKYGSHPALLRFGRRRLPLVFIYDSYLIPAAHWASVFAPSGTDSVRGTSRDVIALGLLVKGDVKEKEAIIQSGFDGFYTCKRILYQRTQGQ